MNTPNVIKKEEKVYQIEDNSKSKKYQIKIIKEANSIIFNATEIGDIKGTLFKICLGLNDFVKIDKYFRQFDTIDEIYLDISNKTNNELKVEENDKNLKIVMINELRHTTKEFPFILIRENTDINKIIMNLCEKTKEIDILKKENEKLKNDVAELKYCVRCIYDHQKRTMPFMIDNKWIKDCQNNDWKKLNLRDYEEEEDLGDIDCDEV